ncbi:MAG TPA: MG2 domain-containing protein, partial [Myxococcales bacterium]
MLWLLITAALAGCATEPPAAVVVAAPKASAAVAQVEPQSIAEEPVAQRQITISSCERAGCELVFRFAQPMPDARVELDPPQAGSQRWTGEKELTFTPGRGAMGWGHEATARIGAQSWHIAVPNFVVAGKVASWPVIEGKPRFIAFLGGREQIGRGPIYLLYDQRVDPNAVARHIEAEDGESRPVAVRLWRPARVESYYGPIDSDVVLALQMLHPPPSGTRLKLSVPGYVGGVRLLEDHSFEVLTDFRLERSGSERLDRAPQELEFRLHSTTPVSGAALRDAWRISPKPARLYVYGDDRELYVSASLQPGKAYRFELPKGFRDALGNRLQKALKLRVQVQDLSPSLQLPRGPLVVERGGARLPIVGVNIGAVRAELHRYRTPAEFIKPGETCEGPVAFRARGRGAGAINRKAVQDLPLAGVKPGLYCVDVAAEGRGSEAGGEMLESMRVQVSNLGATAKVYAGRVFAWVTRLDDPQPMARARVSVIDESGARYGSGVTAKDGIAVLDAPPEGKKLFLLVQHKNDAAVLELSDERLSQAWKFSLPGVVAGQRPLAAAVFTDRGAYRPGESVRVKMIVRDPITFRIPPDGEVNVSVQDSRGQKVIEKSVALDMLGSADLEVPVKEGAPVGEYTVRVAQGAFSAMRRFRVEEYRVPTFEVTVSAQESEWKPGEEIHATAEAKYLHGGNLGGREVKWQVTTAREPFAPAAFPGFIFGDGRASAPQADGQVASGEGKLDGAGKISFSFKADVHGGPARFVAEATVTDVDRQAYAGRLTHVVHPAAVYVGARQPPERVLSKGDVLEVPLVAVRPDGSAQAGVEVRAVLSRVDYHTVARLAPDSVQLLSRPVYEEGEECLAVTTQSGAVCRFLVENAGEHSLTVRAQEASAAFTFLAAGRSRAAWPRFDRERIELVADKPSYQPGDVARLVVQTPYPHARGLLTLERDGVIEHRLFQIDGDTPAIEVKIAERHAPNVFASVVLLRGRVHGEKNAAGQETGA